MPAEVIQSPVHPPSLIRTDDTSGTGINGPDPGDDTSGTIRRYFGNVGDDTSGTIRRYFGNAR